jgi:uncharacterized RmlC-like cupin family protein
VPPRGDCDHLLACATAIQTPAGNAEAATMTILFQSASPKGYRVVHPPERQDGSGQGVTREFGVSGSSAGSTHLSMAYGVVPAGATSTRHSHPFETAVYVISGRARAYFGLNDEEWVDVGAGDFLYIPADLPHSTANIGDTQVEYVLARAAPEDLVIPVK